MYHNSELTIDFVRKDLPGFNANIKLVASKVLSKDRALTDEEEMNLVQEIVTQFTRKHSHFSVNEVIKLILAPKSGYPVRAKAVCLRVLATVCKERPDELRPFLYELAPHIEPYISDYRFLKKAAGEKEAVVLLRAVLSCFPHVISDDRVASTAAYIGELTLHEDRYGRFSPPTTHSLPALL